MAIFIKSNSKMMCVSVLWLSNGSDFLMCMCSGTVCQHCILARRARPSYTFFWSRVFLHTNLAMAALQLNRLLSDYLTDESTVHVNVPFVTETIINNDLLNDQQKDDNDDLAAVKRKWTVRLNALLQSRQPMARWAAISLVKLTCEQSSSLYTANAQTWCAQCLGFLAVSFFLLTPTFSF